MYKLYKDGILLIESNGDISPIVKYVHNTTPQSLSHAVTYEGYRITYNDVDISKDFILK